MDSLIPVHELRTEDLLRDWRWLCPDPMELLAVSGFGELLLERQDGAVVFLDIHEGRLTPVAESKKACESLMGDGERTEELLKLAAVESLRKRGLVIKPGQCVTYKIPVVLAEGPPQICAVDVYEAVGFLGSVHRQIKELPEGSKIRLEMP